MQANYRTAIILGIIGVAGTFGAKAALADGASFESAIISRDSVVFGRTYSEWAAQWWQWSLSLPANAHPLFDTADCAQGQSGPVFFLGGKVCATGATNCTPGLAKRRCTVPAGKPLFFPIVNTEDSTLEEGAASSMSPACVKAQPTPTIDCMRQFSQTLIDGATNLTAEIDHQSIPGLKVSFRVQSPAFDFTLPKKNNLLNAVGEGPFEGGTYSLAVDDGVYVMLEPLSVGDHTLRITGSFPQFDFNMDVLYHLTVEP